MDFIDEFDNIVQIHTDSIVFNKEVQFNTEIFKNSHMSVIL